jgi:hypothetical protein
LHASPKTAARNTTMHNAKLFDDIEKLFKINPLPNDLSMQQDLFDQASIWFQDSQKTKTI